MNTNNKRLTRVRAADLLVDPRAQRPTDKRTAARMAKIWNPLAVGAVIVSLRADGTMYVLDGAHRAMAAVQVDPEYLIDAVVHTGLSIQQEAAVFNVINEGRRSVRKHEQVEPHATAGDPIALAFKRVLANHNLKHDKTATPNQIAAVEACNKILRKHGEAVLDQTIAVLDAAWTERSAHQWNNVMLTAVSIMLGDGKADPVRLTETLSTRMPEAWFSGLAVSNTGQDGYQRVLYPLATRYNKGLRSNNRVMVDFIEWYAKRLKSAKAAMTF